MSLSDPLIINRPSVIFDTQGAETVVIDLASGHYFRLDGASTRFWVHFLGPVSADAVVAAAENPEALEPDIARIIDELVGAGLLRPPTGEERVAEAVETWRYEGFTLEVFTDLEDILGLDPIHEVDPERGWPHLAEG